MPKSSDLRQLPRGNLEADVERGAAEGNKTVLRKCERRINLQNTITDVVVAITANGLAAARGASNTNDADGTAGYTAVET